MYNDARTKTLKMIFGIIFLLAIDGAVFGGSRSPPESSDNPCPGIPQVDMRLGWWNPHVKALPGRTAQEWKLEFSTRAKHCRADSIGTREIVHFWAQGKCPQRNRPVSGITSCQATGEEMILPQELMNSYLPETWDFVEQCCSCIVELDC